MTALQIFDVDIICDTVAGYIADLDDFKNILAVNRKCAECRHNTRLVVNAYSAHFGETALASVVYRGASMSVIRRLLDRTHPSRLDYALRGAVKAGRDDIAIEILDPRYGLELTHRLYDMKVPELAASEGRARVLPVLIEVFSDWMDDYRVALIVKAAVSSASVETVRSLLECIDNFEQHRGCAMRWAIVDDCRPVIDYLLSITPDINQVFSTPEFRSDAVECPSSIIGASVDCYLLLLHA